MASLQLHLHISSSFIKLILWLTAKRLLNDIIDTYGDRNMHVLRVQHCRSI